MGSERIKGIWPQWQLIEELGRGSYGVVYKALREEHGVVSYSAIKVISIPQQETEELSIRADGLDDTATRKYFENIVESTVDEIKVLESMKGNSNIVSIEDYIVLSEPERIGWDIFIRMEYLTPFLDFVADKKLDEAMVIKLGIDICNALELCAKRGIVHRDIKPENIFVSQFGDFKLGDFGIARELAQLDHTLTISGTKNYIAPEVRSMHYDATVDIYSLGLVLYKLLNRNRLPFLDPFAQLINPQDYQAALNRRFSGEEFPDPVDASPALTKVLRKACEFDHTKRFQTATAFKNALCSVKDIKPVLRSVAEWTDEDITEQMALPTKVVIAEPVLEAEQYMPYTPNAPACLVPLRADTVVSPVQYIEPKLLVVPAPPTPIPQPKIGPGYIKKQPVPQRPENKRVQPQKTRNGGMRGVIWGIALIAVVIIVGVIVSVST